MDPCISFETPESGAAPFRKLCDDSGYLSTTPDSAGVSWMRSGAATSRHSDVNDRCAKRPCPLYRKYQDLYNDSPAQLYTPEVTFPWSFKAKRMTLRKHKSLPISGEESQVIEDFLPEPLPKLSYDCEEDMVIDEDLHNFNFDELQNRKHEENEVELDPGNCSMYEEADMSCNGEESSFVDMKEINTLEQESLSLNDLSVDFNTPQIKTVFPVTSRFLSTGVEMEEVSKEVPPVDIEEVSKYQVQPVYHNWRDNLMLKNGSKMLDDFADRKSTVDFLYYLGVASDHSNIVSRILSFVPQCDLTALTRVSKSWRSVVTSDKPSRRRLAKARRIILTPEKENSLKNKKEENSAARVGALLPIGNLFGDLPPAAPSAPSSTKRSDSFYEHARCMKDGYRNDRCAKCDGCAAVHIETSIGRCPSPCKYVYCARCKTADHRPSPCVCVGDLNLWDAAQYRKARICSKNSKRRLLRL